MEERKENVLLLNMSILPNDMIPKYHTWYFGNGENYEGVFLFGGKSQLEAGTKHILSSLLYRGEVIDRVVITCSPDTLKNSKNGGLSAKDFYIKRILDFLKGSGDEFDGDGNAIIKSIETELEKTDNKRDGYREVADALCSRKISVINNRNFMEKLVSRYADKGQDFFSVVKMEDVNTENAKTIKELGKKILGMSESVNVYMDIQGGDRSFTYVLNALMALNKKEVIDVKQAISIKYQGSNFVNEIKDSTNSFRMVELITAMNAFTNYGRGDLLVKYFSDNGYDSSSEERSLVDTIEDISDAIRISDPNSLTDAFNKLRRILSNVEEFNNPYLEYVRKTIDEDYGSVLRNVDSTDTFEEAKRNLDVIDWCIRKGFIQQGLTLIEDKMPDLFMDEKVIRQEIFVPDERLKPGSFEWKKRVKDAAEGQDYQSYNNSRFYSFMTKIRKEEDKNYKKKLYAYLEREIVKKVRFNDAIDVTLDEGILEELLNDTNFRKEYAEELDFDITDLLMRAIEYSQINGSQEVCKGYKRIIKTLVGGKELPCNREEAHARMLKFLSGKMEISEREIINCTYFASRKEALKEGKKIKTGNQENLIGIIREHFIGNRPEALAIRNYLIVKGVFDKIESPQYREYIAGRKKKEITEKIESLMSQCINTQLNSKDVELIYTELSEYVDFGAKRLPANEIEFIDFLIEESLEKDAEALKAYKMIKEKYRESQDNVTEIKEEIKNLDNNYNSNSDYDEHLTEQFTERYILFRDLQRKIDAHFDKTGSKLGSGYSNILRLEVIQTLIEDEYGLNRQGNNYGTWIGVIDNKEYHIVPQKKENKSHTCIVKSEINKKIVKNAKEIDLLLRLHEALKQERNNSNHASDKGLRLGLNIVEQMMRIYVDMCRKYIVEPLS